MTTKEYLKIIGEDILRHCPEQLKTPVTWPGTREAYRLDVQGFTTDYLKLHRTEATLSLDGSIIGASVFTYFQTVTIYTLDREEYIITPLPDTVIIDPSTKWQRDGVLHPGRYRFTEMHEDSHHILYRAGLFHPEPVEYRCTGGPDSPAEQEADGLAACLLMPDPVLLAMLRHRDYAPIPCYEGTYTVRDGKLLCAMERQLGVSHSALVRRLADAGLLEERSIYEFYDPDLPPGQDPLERLIP